MPLGPRVVIAGTHSGVGKTTVATGLMAALVQTGLGVASAKVGPDFIDPGYHRVATGSAGRNLDVFLSGADAIAPLAARAAESADLLVIEGVMGLFDGVGSTIESSTAHVATLLDAPVVLVVDAAAMSGSVAALVHGFDDTLCRVEGRTEGLAGIILNRVGSETHGVLLREALEPLGIPVLGTVLRDPAMVWRDRHLGLVPVVEDPSRIAESLERLAALIERSVDLAGIEALARRAPTTSTHSLPSTTKITGDSTVRVGVAGGRAFSFAYPDNLDRLREAGAELVVFDPLEATALPEGIGALYAGGGFPEVFVNQLAENVPLLADVRRRAESGLIIWAECGGLLWLCSALDGHRLCAIIDAEATMGNRVTVGYRTAIVRRDNPVAVAGAELRGHELHYSTVNPAGDALRLVGRTGAFDGGWATPTLFASYLHMHLGADPTPAERFVGSAFERACGHGSPMGQSARAPGEVRPAHADEGNEE